MTYESLEEKMDRPLQERSVVRDIGATESSLLEMLFGVDFWRFWQYADKSEEKGNILLLEIMKDKKSRMFF